MLDLTAPMPVHLQMSTRIEQAGEITAHHFDEPGQLVQMGSTLYLRYRERDPETGAQTPVTMKIQGDGLVILTRGQADLRLQLHFHPTERMTTAYKTPYGEIPVTTATTLMESRIKSEPLHGEVAIDYQLFSEKELLGKYQLRLIFKA
ncbi:DUF1934 domain-containing protein [Lapidilactobacillus achengensis]|uniref:DUF1934 domain-containing protein n=1 Tax=Lapidilactobacillus achengensis TaxID=2486000 RepID=A0ABW1UT15_9LACO|nr:DUF1934 domain-containing protein [Lapidilactobacillus achengensis]